MAPKPARDFTGAKTNFYFVQQVCTNVQCTQILVSNVGYSLFICHQKKCERVAMASESRDQLVECTQPMKDANSSQDGILLSYFVEVHTLKYTAVFAYLLYPNYPVRTFTMPTHST